MASFTRHRRAMAIWLLVLCAVTIAMVVLGGLTRLTESGLSMTTWSVTGSLPPLTEASWLAEFERYKSFPEYQKVNLNMALPEFQRIFWFEYSHRMLGRTIGTAFALPFLYFLVRRAVPGWLLPRLLGLFALGGLQGLIGWWMVRSGLVDRPDVSHYRLTIHLGAALLLVVSLLWVALGLWRTDAADKPTPQLTRLAWAATALVAMIYTTALTGGLVAGLNAGFAFNTFPLMAGRIIPPGFLSMTPWWMSFTENIATVQFDHRVLALTTASVGVVVWAVGRRRPLPRSARRATGLLLAAVVLQVTLGITTLLSGVWLPAASLHQLGAVALLTAATLTAHTLHHPTAP